MAGLLDGSPLRGPKNLLAGKRPVPAQIGVYVFVIVPFLALVAAVPVVWGWGLTWLDVILAGTWYTVTCLGVTVGFHRYFTHGSFKAKRPLRLALAIVGSMAVQGPILHWVYDVRWPTPTRLARIATPPPERLVPRM